MEVACLHSSSELGKVRPLPCIQSQMLSRSPRPSIRQISHSSDPHPSKRAKTAASQRHEAIGGRAKAEIWFHDTNNNASGTKDAPYLDSVLHLQLLMSR